ncbi:(S)-ureidoglycine aminohydrolase [Roseomonas sp. USHLN139]|uniref:(S)-ureidoglycine aminohydrolase n=1 Tax=Roseomonas sp. USHLN139 TaxID=3081298 RepID=UPI003B01BBB4
MQPHALKLPPGRMLPGAVGLNRGVVRPNYAFLPPEGVLKSRLPNYEKTAARFLAAPALGARFAQFILEIEPGGGSLRPVAEAGIQHFYYVLSGEVSLSVGDLGPKTVDVGGFLYAPPGLPLTLRNAGAAPARVLGLRKRYQALEGVAPPGPILSHTGEVPRTNHTGLEGRGFQHLLPFGDLAFDFEMNLMWFGPGTFFPAVETHIMEHGLYMLQGQGLYLLGTEWHEIWQDDFIWMGAFCPQQFYPTGPDEAAYLLYKDMNRDVYL